MTPKIYQWSDNEFKQMETENVKRQCTRLLQGFKDRNILIGLCVEKSAKLALLMQSVRQSGNAFCWLDPRADSSLIKNRCLRMRVKVLMSKQQLEWPSTSWTLDNEAQIWINELPFADNLNVFGPRFTYSICTSGTTGQPKCVLVPPEAIMPNVQDFMGRLNLGSESRLMWSTSLDFDPSFLELLLALELNCSLFIVDDVNLKRIWQFTSMIKKVQPNVLQITPAVLSLFPNEFLLELFGSESLIENLLIGGDTFPVAFIKRYAKNCSAKIYNVYGVTEVSCWASCTRFDPEIDHFADASDSILDTRLRFSVNGVEIYGRGCVVDGEKRQSTQTGDQFLQVDDNGRIRYVITSREKINGVIVSREVEEYLLGTFDFVEAARLVTYSEQLFMFVKRASLGNELVEVPEKFRIKQVFYIDRFPITTNGKIDDTALRLRIQQDVQLRSITGTVSDYLQANPDLRQSDVTIASLGFSSKDLFEFIFEIQQRRKGDEDNTKTLGQQLFNEKTPVSYFFELISRCHKNEDEKPNDYTELQAENGRLLIELRQTFQMKKCVDFSAEHYNDLIFVGDMSGYFAIFNIQTNKPAFEQQHNAAVISKPLIHFGFVIYCTVDGYLHWINLSNFELKSENIGDSCKSDPCPFDDSRIFVAVFAKHLILLDLKTGEFEEVCEFAEGLIRNAPLVCDNFVIASTIDATIGSFRKDKFTKMGWRHDLKKTMIVPLFVLPDTNQFGALALDGCLYFMNVQTGEITRQFDFHVACPIQPTVLFDSNLIVVPCAKDTFQLIRWQGLCDMEAESVVYKLPGLQVQSRVVYSKSMDRFLVKCDTKEDATCKLLAINFEAQKFGTVLELDAPSFGDPLIVSTSNDVEQLILGARDNCVYLFDLTRTA